MFHARFAHARLHVGAVGALQTIWLKYTPENQHGPGSNGILSPTVFLYKPVNFTVHVGFQWGTVESFMSRTFSQGGLCSFDLKSMCRLRIFGRTGAHVHVVSRHQEC